MTAQTSNPARSVSAMFESLAREAHVWYCDPREITDAARIETLIAMCSQDERDRWQRFHYENDSHSYLVSHALRRKVLSLYADIPPARWAFSDTPRGKPVLADEFADLALAFNLSHADGLVACVVSRGIDCGIDAEILVRNNNLQAIAGRMFAETERATISACDESEMRRQFFNYWTLREAYVKALGTGIAGASRAYHFELGVPGGAGRPQSARISQPGADNPSPDWQFELFAHDTQHVMAVALNSGNRPREIRWTYREP